MIRVAASAALLVVGITARAFAQDGAALAQQPFERGLAMYEAGQFAPAIDQFRVSLALYDSPNAMLYLARSLRRTGRLAEAVLVYERTVAESGERAVREPRYVETRDAASNELQTLLPEVARLTLHTQSLPPDATVHVGERALPASAASGLTLPVDPGDVNIEITREGHAAVHRTMRAAAGETVSIELALAVESPRAAPERFHMTPVGWLGGSTATLGAAGFGVFYALASAQFQDLEAHCTAPCGDSHAADIARGRTYETMVNVSIGVAVVGLVVGTAASIVAVVRSRSRRAESSRGVRPFAGGWTF